jgi:hypothetical protein
MFDTGGVERGGTAHDAMHIITFLNQKFGQERTVLSGNTGD